MLNFSYNNNIRPTKVKAKINIDKGISVFPRSKNLLLFFFVFQTIFFSNTYCQTISVSGKVTSSRFPVKYASVTFIDKTDTTTQYTTITDEQGEYEIGVVTSVKSNTTSAQVKFNLGQSYPNPTSSSAAIPYGLNRESNVQLTIYDILGRVIRQYEIGHQTEGTHSILWDGRNGLGQRVATGIYFYRLNAGGESQVKKMIFNSSGNTAIPVPNTYSLTESISLTKVNSTQNLLAGEFTIRVGNTETTSPLVVPQEIDNVVLQNDTTINFAVSNRPVTSIDSDDLHQIIRGFGAANILLWRGDMTSGEIETAFGTDDGQLGFSILRIMLEPDSNRWSVYLPTAKKAFEMGAIIIAAPWYAPDELSEDVGDINRVRHDKYAEYAEHLNSFVKYMSENGVPVYGVSIQNEPDIEENWTSWTSDEIFTFMKDYANVIEGTNIMAPESFHFDRSYSDPILNDSAAAVNTDIICGHIYGGGLAKYPLAGEKGKEVWMTEHLSGENSTPDDWSWALDAGVEINDVMNASMNAYVWWYLVRYYGPISDGTYLRKGEVTKKGYVMSQFARFIRPGYYRVEAATSPARSNIEVTAYKDSSTSKMVIVAINTGTSEVEHTIRLGSETAITAVTPYTTSETKDCEKGDNINVANGSFSFALEPLSITTFVSD